MTERDVIMVERIDCHVDFRRLKAETLKIQQEFLLFDLSTGLCRFLSWRKQKYLVSVTLSCVIV